MASPNADAEMSQDGSLEAGPQGAESPPQQPQVEDVDQIAIDGGEGEEGKIGEGEEGKIDEGNPDEGLEVGDGLGVVDGAEANVDVDEGKLEGEGAGLDDGEDKEGAEGDATDQKKTSEMGDNDDKSSSGEGAIIEEEKQPKKGGWLARIRAEQLERESKAAQQNYERQKKLKAILESESEDEDDKFGIMKLKGGGNVNDFLTKIELHVNAE